MPTTAAAGAGGGAATHGPDGVLQATLGAGSRVRREGGRGQGRSRPLLRYPAQQVSFVPLSKRVLSACPGEICPPVGSSVFLAPAYEHHLSAGIFLCVRLALERAKPITSRLLPLQIGRPQLKVNIILAEADLIGGHGPLLEE